MGKYEDDDQCTSCGSMRVYCDKYGHYWCEDCGRWNGWQTLRPLQEPLFEPRWPGDPQGWGGTDAPEGHAPMR